MNQIHRIAVSPAFQLQRTRSTVSKSLRLNSRFSSTQPPPPGSDDGDTIFPNLMIPEPVLDAHEVRVFPPSKDSPFRNRVIVRNDDGAPLFPPDTAENGATTQGTTRS